MKLERIGFAIAAAALALGSPAAALDDISGTYAGKMSCKGYAAGAPSKAKHDVTIEVAEGKVNLMRILIGMNQLGSNIHFTLAEDSAKQDRGKVGGVDCTLGWLTQNGLSVQADAVVKPGSEKGTLKGEVQHLDAEGIVETCSFSVKRASTTPPQLGVCQFPE
jgi:hypothetical protein